MEYGASVSRHGTLGLQPRGVGPAPTCVTILTGVPQKFYHSSPKRFRHGDILTGNRSGGYGSHHQNVCMTTSPEPHGSIAHRVPGWSGTHIEELDPDYEERCAEWEKKYGRLEPWEAERRANRPRIQHVTGTFTRLNLCTILSMSPGTANTRPVQRRSSGISAKARAC